MSSSLPPQRSWEGVREADGGVMSHAALPMTPPSPYDGDTSPSRNPRRGGSRPSRRVIRHLEGHCWAIARRRARAYSPGNREKTHDAAGSAHRRFFGRGVPPLPFRCPATEGRRPAGILQHAAGRLDRPAGAQRLPAHHPSPGRPLVWPRMGTLRSVR